MKTKCDRIHLDLSNISGVPKSSLVELLAYARREPLATHIEPTPELTAASV